MRRQYVVALTLALAAAVAAPLGPAQAATTTGSISGVAFEDANRNGAVDPGEAAWSNQVLYLFDGQGGYVGGTQSDALGRYSFPELPAGTYVVEYAANRWWELRETWVPTTTGSLLPKQRVDVGGAATADFGWRRIVRSTTAGQPVSQFTGASGLRVESYNDVVSARELHDTLASGALGAEAPSTVVRFALSSSSTTSTSIGATAGRYDSFAAYVYVSWLSWLDQGPDTLAHEYGHAWGMYRAYLVQQDPTLAGYLAARGLSTNDPRLDTNHAWGRDELLAEDYRQLLGPPAGRTSPQANSELPRASDVPGLKDYLVGAFSGSASSTAPTPSPSPSASTSPSPWPSPEPSPTPTASATPTASPTPVLSPSPTASSPSKKGGGCRRGSC